jgi:hypothetical protein
MAQVDTTQAGAQAAKELGLGETAAEEVVEQVSTEEPEVTSGEVVEPEEVTPPAKKVSETIPLQRFNEVYGRMKELERTLLEVAKAGPKTTPRVEEKEPDWDTLTGSEMAHAIFERVGTKVGDIINRTVTPVRDTFEQERVARDIAETAAKHPDFWDHREKMVAFAERHPTLTAEEAYYLASSNTVAVKKSIAQRMNAQVQKKKAARTEMRSSPAEKITENKEYKTVKEAAFAAAKKLGMV